ncbi:class I SAM-dependent methyltransferase [Flavobacterium sp. 123]|uniref:class I SAM-dependent methyltransferase n=1 Tax=Flavobacterium sp. 123 TaxID=2135627 RepID=UPI000EAB8AB7|nr:class I SAM-dependent methyltransferase [Flavobacterium sp. 123]RKT00009.1 methyltransferase family protein [Flavobacterium sp. 123]
MIKKSTGERLEFYEFSDVTIEHFHRYSVVLDIVKGRRVLDIASGEGYGSSLLSKSALSVIGVDIDNDSIENAKIKYTCPNLEFRQGSTSNVPVPDNSVDVVVSFETIEHHDKHEEMMLEIKRVLTATGTLIMSSPDKEFYSDKIEQNNIYHIKELYFKEFKALINSYFKQASFYFQKSYNFNSIISNENSYKEIEIFSGDNLNVIKNKIEPLYNIVIASDVEIFELKTSIFEGSKIKNLQMEKNIKRIHDTLTFKIGKFICYPFFYLKSKK